jgi:tetratricopeptide (TPR) repeat protein
MKDHRRFTTAYYFTRISIEFPQASPSEPVFILHTNQFDEASELLRRFPVSILTTNRQSLKNLPIKSTLDTSGSDILAMEFSLDDPYPEHIIDRIVIPNDQRDRLLKSNLASKTIRIALEEDSHGFLGRKKRTAQLPGAYSPYIVDWWGTHGLMIYLRNAMGNKPNPQLLHALELHLKEYGPATGIWCEIGFFHRLAEDWEKAIAAYKEEIRLGLKSDGHPGIGSAKALNNMGVVYKKTGKFDLAADCFALALDVNPNYFETLISTAGVQKYEKVALSCVARALRINAKWPDFPQFIRAAAAAWERQESDVLRYLERESESIDLTKPLIAVIPDAIDVILDRLGI